VPKVNSRYMYNSHSDGGGGSDVVTLNEYQ